MSEDIDKAVLKRYVSLMYDWVPLHVAISL